MTAYEWIVELLDAVGSRPAGATVRQCPAHHDGAPSLSVGEGDDGRALLYCHAGCRITEIMGALHCPMGRLFTPAPIAAATHAATFCADLNLPALERRPGEHPTARGMRLEAEHPYGDRWWLLRYRHRVTGAKTVSWECLNHQGERVPGLLGTPTRELPLYRQREAQMAISLDEVVLLVESESSVDALKGWYATTWAGGAATPQLHTLHRVVAGYPRLVVIGDADDAGRGCVNTLRAAGLAPHVLYSDIDGEDARDLYTRLGPNRFATLVHRTCDQIGPDSVSRRSGTETNSRVRPDERPWGT